MLFFTKGQYTSIGDDNVTALLLLTHIFFTVKLKVIQRHTFTGIKYTFSKKDGASGIGTYRAFASALGTTIGPGNIVGVAVAVSAGGTGAVLWMWLCGILSMSTKYAESYLALKYSDNGVGGTMVLLKKINARRLSILWTLACAAGGLFMGASVPSSSLALSIPLPPIVTGTFLALLTLVTVSLGFDGISKVCSLVVPVMSGVFLLFCLYITADNIELLPRAFADMFKGAFTVDGVLGAGLGLAAKNGIARGLYSNESGLGSGGVLAAESGDKNIELASLSAMTTAFWDTVVMCAVTGTAFAVTGAGYDTPAKTVMANAFERYSIGPTVLAFSMTLFVFATVVGWYYIAKRTLTYSFKNSWFYDALYIGAVFFGALAPPDILWASADAVNTVMLLPSLYVLFRMSNKINLYIKDK